jgi:hypothetical protein
MPSPATILPRLPGFPERSTVLRQGCPRSTSRSLYVVGEVDVPQPGCRLAHRLEKRESQVGFDEGRHPRLRERCRDWLDRPGAPQENMHAFERVARLAEANSQSL